MKRSMEPLCLRDAFGPVPQSCRDALMNAARSVKEEEPMKRRTLRVALIAALIVLSMTAAALAAGSVMGWKDFFGGSHSTVHMPGEASRAMQVQDGLAVQVGPVTFTVKELLTDGHIALASVHARMTDGSAALMCADPFDQVGASGEDGRAEAQRLGVSPKTTWAEAAQQLQTPLYLITALMDVPPENADGEMMSDPMWNGDGSVTCFSMPAVKNAASGLEAGLYLRVDRIDPLTGEAAETWRNDACRVSVPACPLEEERTYLPEQDVTVAGLRLSAVHAQRYLTGAYLTLHWEVDPQLLGDEVWDLYDVALADADGVTLPCGVSMTARLTAEVTVEDMVGLETLPDVLTLTDETRLIGQ